MNERQEKYRPIQNMNKINCLFTSFLLHAHKADEPENGEPSREFAYHPKVGCTRAGGR